MSVISDLFVSFVKQVGEATEQHWIQTEVKVMSQYMLMYILRIYNVPLYIHIYTHILQMIMYSQWLIKYKTKM